MPNHVRQESVWDYPRPPRLEHTDRIVRVEFAGIVIANSNRTIRVLETSHPPVYYVPREDASTDCLIRTPRSSYCEWKGRATYFDVTASGLTAPRAAWTYENPTPEFAEIASYVAFYPARVDACYVDDELVASQAGDFYGGWITGDIRGPFKGAPGTGSW